MKQYSYEHMICITNRHLCQGDFYERLEQIAEKRPAAVILREKDLSEEEYEKMLIQCREILKGRVPLYAHSYMEAAKRAGMNRIHLPMPLLRQYVLESQESGNRKEKTVYFSKIGASVHSVKEALEAQQLGASYVTAGHIFATDCKKGVPGRGLAFLKEVCEAVSIPVYAIGGMNEANLSLMMKMGAAGSCMMSGFMRKEI